jgi:hypothetical protein
MKSTGVARNVAARRVFANGTISFLFRRAARRENRDGGPWKIIGFSWPQPFHLHPKTTPPRAAVRRDSSL